MSRARREWVLDLVFLIGLAGKGIDGFVELLIGVPLLFVRPAQITAIAHLLTAQELREDPHDLIAHLVLHGASSLSADAALFTAAYLIIHGLAKVAIVIALVRGSQRVYPWAIGVLGAFVVAQVVDIAIHPSLGVIALSLFDCLIIWLTWREWRHHRSLHDVLRTTGPWPARRFREVEYLK